jgi:hypothetical protein
MHQPMQSIYQGTDPVSAASWESGTERSSDPPVSLESCSEPALCYADLSDAARRARACHPAYVGRIRALVRPCEPPRSA